MTKYFVDTNIFLRYYLKDHPELSPLAKEIFDDCQMGRYALVLCSVTIQEIVWTLGSFYKQPKEKITLFIDEILKTKNLIMTDQELIKKMWSTYKTANIDAADAYFSALMDQENIKQIFSFDHDFDKIKSVKRLAKSPV